MAEERWAQGVQLPPPRGPILILLTFDKHPRALDEVVGARWTGRAVVYHHFLLPGWDEWGEYGESLWSIWRASRV